MPSIGAGLHVSGAQLQLVIDGYSVLSARGMAPGIPGCSRRWP
jgi:hypothetical protein